MCLVPAATANTVLSLDGVNDYIDIPNSGSAFNFGTSDFSVELWFRTSATGADQTLFYSEGTRSERGSFTLKLNGNGYPYYKIVKSDLTVEHTLSQNLADGEWHHLSVVRKYQAAGRFSTELWVDGGRRISSLRGASSSVYTRDVILDQKFSVGARYSGSPGSSLSAFFTGEIDGVGIWNVNRSSNMAGIYNEKRGTETGLLSYYNFEEGVADGDNSAKTSVQSKTGAHAGTLKNFAKTGSSSNFVTSAIPSFLADATIVFGDTSRELGAVSPTMTATSNSTGTFSYESSNAAVASIDSSTGVLTLNATGTATITATLSGTTAFRAEVATAVLTVLSSASAPTLSSAPASITVEEDVSSAVDLSSLVFADADGDALVASFTVSAGTFDKAPPVSFAVVASRVSASEIQVAGSAAAINSYLDSAEFSYLTAADAAGSNVASLTVRANDGTTNPLLATLAIDSTDTAEAPELDASESPQLTAIALNAGDDDGSGADDDDDALNNTNNGGTAVADIIVDGSITDSDAVGAVPEAIAVVGVDNTNGYWQFSTDNGASWSDFTAGTGSESFAVTARLLDGSVTGSSTHKIRYVPKLNSTATATLTFRAWDKSSGTAGATADATSTGDPFAFSAVSDTASIGLSGGNSFPYATGLPSELSVPEDDTSNLDLSALTTVDADDDTLTLTLGTTAGSFATPVDGAGVVETRVSATEVTLEGLAADINSYLDTASNLRFTPVADANGSPYATLSLSLDDGTVNRPLGAIALTVTAVNDAPVLDVSASPALTSIVEDLTSDTAIVTSNRGTEVSVLVPASVLSDADGSPVRSIVVTAVDNTNGVWQYNFQRYSNSGWRDFSATTGGLVDLTTSAMPLVGQRTGTVENRIRFVPDLNWSGTATLKFRAWDRSSLSHGVAADVSTNGGTTSVSSAEETATIVVTAVNDAPSDTLWGGYAE